MAAAVAIETGTSASAQAGADVLSLRQVSCELGGAMVVAGVTLDLARGELGCLLGPSGCGKTTLLRAIGGFQPLAGGSIALRGATVSDTRRQLAPERRRVGFVFQDLALFPHLTVQANVAFGLHRLPRGERAARVAQTLSMLGLDGLDQRYPDELSGGQQQRVAVARALAPQPDLLLLDEPFSSLDAHLRASLREELRALLKRLGIAALLVTHDQDEAFAFADRVGVMRAGRLEQWAPSFEVYHRPATPFVARFVGEGRLLPALVEEDDRVRSALGRFMARLPAGAKVGDRVQMLVRPDDLLPDGEIGMPVTVVAASFRGAETLYTLRLSEGTEVCALFPSHHRHALGEQIRIRTDLAHVVVFDAER